MSLCLEYAALIITRTITKTITRRNGLYLFLFVLRSGSSASCWYVCVPSSGTSCNIFSEKWVLADLVAVSPWTAAGCVFPIVSVSVAAECVSTVMSVSVAVECVSTVMSVPVAVECVSTVVSVPVMVSVIRRGETEV